MGIRGVLAVEIETWTSRIVTSVCIALYLRRSGYEVAGMHSRQFCCGCTTTCTVEENKAGRHHGENAVRFSAQINIPVPSTVHCTRSIRWKSAPGHIASVRRTPAQGIVYSRCSLRLLSATQYLPITACGPATF